MTLKNYFTIKQTDTKAQKKKPHKKPQVCNEVKIWLFYSTTEQNHPHSTIIKERFTKSCKRTTFRSKSSKRIYTSCGPCTLFYSGATFRKCINFWLTRAQWGSASLTFYIELVLRYGELRIYSEYILSRVFMYMYVYVYYKTIRIANCEGAGFSQCIVIMVRLVAWLLLFGVLYKQQQHKRLLFSLKAFIFHYFECFIAIN